MVGFALKRGVTLFGIGGTNGSNFDMLHHAGSFMELAIGISLIVIGLVGIKEAREWNSDDIVALEEGKSLSSAATPVDAASPSTAKSAVLFNGILHGFSWDGAPSLAPAVAIATWRGSLTFLVSYALGTMAAMTLATTVIGEGTRRASKKLDRPDLPRDLSVGSSFLALFVGVVWCVLALR
jgi:sulfite exporter TauE/SafE